MTRPFARATLIAFSLVIVTACKRDAPAADASTTDASATVAKNCTPYSTDLMQAFSGGLLRPDFRIANAWVIKSEKAMESGSTSVPAYFVSADIVAPNGEAVVGTWVTDDIAASGHVYSVSPLARKYTRWGGVGDAATAGISMDTGGAKESAQCVLTHRSPAAADSVRH